MNWLYRCTTCSKVVFPGDLENSPGCPDCKENEFKRARLVSDYEMAEVMARGFVPDEGAFERVDDAPEAA